MMTVPVVAKVLAVCLGAAQPVPPTAHGTPPTPGEGPESNAAQWDAVDRISPPTPAPAPAQVDPPAPTPAPAPAVPQRPPERRVGNGALGAGIASMSIGFVSLVFVAGIAGLVKLGAVNNAKNPNTAISSREDRYNRARRADTAMEVGFWVGMTGIGVGVALIAVGATMKSRARREAVARRVSPTAGGIAIRF